MKLLILGATGPTGIQLVRLAIKAGHDTTAVVRDRSKMTEQSDLFTVIWPDILDVEAMTLTTAQQGCVVSALGGGRDLHSTIVSEAMVALVPAMLRSKVKRLIFLSSFGEGDTKKKARLPARFFFSTVLKKVMADKEKADNMLRSPELGYTLVYPSRLTDGEYTG